MTNLHLLNPTLQRFIATQDKAARALEAQKRATLKAEIDNINAEEIRIMNWVLKAVRASGIPANIVITYTTIKGTDAMKAEPVITLGDGLFIAKLRKEPHLVFVFNNPKERLTSPRTKLYQRFLITSTQEDVLEAMDNNPPPNLEGLQAWIAERIKEVLTHGRYIQWAAEAKKSPTAAQLKARCDYTEAYRLYRMAMEANGFAEHAIFTHNHAGTNHLADRNYHRTLAAEANYLTLFNAYPPHICKAVGRSYVAISSHSDAMPNTYRNMQAKKSKTLNVSLHTRSLLQIERG